MSSRADGITAGEDKSPRRRTLRRSLVATFTAVSLLSVLLLGLLNYYQARGLLTDSVSDQLVNQQTAKARAIRNGIDRLEQTVIVTAQDPGVVEALVEFSAAFDQLGQGELLDAMQSDAVDEFYASVDTAIADAGLDLPLPDDLSPRSDVGRFLQYHYIVRNPSEQRSEMVNAAGDETGYGAVHADLHPAFVQLRSQLGFGDVLLVDAEGNVVYSIDKRLDYATNARSGPYRTTGMGDAVTNRIAAAPVGDAVFVDFELYLPAAGKPSLFVASAIRDQARTIGALLVEIPISSLNALTIGDGNWQEAGFGDTAETYVVGRDQLMRTDSRLWIEDPDEYLRTLETQFPDGNLGQLIETFDSTVLLQPVDNSAVLDALDGEQFLGNTRNYLGRTSLTAAGPVGSDQVDWVVVAEIASSEARDSLSSYLRRVLIAGLVLVPIVVLLALFFADRMTKPVRPVVEAASAVAQGQLDTTLPDLGQNEFGDVARRLNLLTADLRANEEALTAEEEEIRHLLLSALPTRLVSALRRGERTLLDLIDTATVVVFDIDGLLDGAGIDEDMAVDLSAEFSTAVESIAERLGVERVRSSTDQHVFAAGLGRPELATDVAAGFALDVVEAIERFKEDHGIEFSFRAGISAGEVIAGLLAAEQLTYGVFGDPPSIALALAGLATPNQVLVDEATVAEMGTAWDLEHKVDLLDLRGERIAAAVLNGRRIESAVDPTSA